MFPQSATPHSILTVVSAVKIQSLTIVSDVSHTLMKALTAQRKPGVKQKAGTQGYTQSV